MKFQDKKTPYGELEKYNTGELTHRFLTIAETRYENEGMQRAIGNLAIAAMTGDGAVEQEDAELMLRYLMQNREQRGRQTMTIEQATRFSKLLRQGSSTLLDDEQSDGVLAVAMAIDHEVAARMMRTDLENISIDDFM